MAAIESDLASLGAPDWRSTHPPLPATAEYAAHLRAIAGEDFSAKDFRTWYATRAAMLALERCTVESTSQAKAQVKRVLAEVAKRLGNTPAICRKSYVHPVVIETFLAGALLVSGRTERGPTERLFRLLARAGRRTPS